MLSYDFVYFRTDDANRCDLQADRSLYPSGVPAYMKSDSGWMAVAQCALWAFGGAWVVKVDDAKRMEEMRLEVFR